MERQSGILLHITSLPGDYGIGDLGSGAYQFINFLSMSGQSLWQILPIGPTGFANSPYQSYSAIAGNVLFISPKQLVTKGLLCEDEIRITRSFPPEKTDYDEAKEIKEHLFRLAFQRFKGDLSSFYHQNIEWLPDFAMFMAIKSQDNIIWTKWPTELKYREPDALESIRESLFDEIQYQIFLQYLFFEQWNNLRKYARKKRIKIIGDLPIFVSLDSADVWSHPELFDLDEQLLPREVAGVPPDYFSKKGQLWGNPLYNWEEHRKQNYSWWKLRFKKLLSLVDIIRLDHFRGFEGYWAVPYGNKTAENGVWRKGPAEDFFYSIKESLKELPIIAEDLGLITPEVEELRDKFKFPGLRVLHFGFENIRSNIHTPHNHSYDCVVYTGTHDNDTTLGWYRKNKKEAQKFIREYLGLHEKVEDQLVVWHLIRTAYASPARMAIIPMQDFIFLDSDARMNMPGTVANNWQWRVKASQLTEDLAVKINHLTNLFAR